MDNKTLRNIARYGVLYLFSNLNFSEDSDRGEPKSGQPVYEEPKPGQQIYEEPKPGQQVYEEPKPGQQIYEEPKPGQQIYEEPKSGQQIHEEPKPGEPVLEKPSSNKTKRFPTPYFNIPKDYVLITGKNEEHNKRTYRLDNGGYNLGKKLPDTPPEYLFKPDYYDNNNGAYYSDDKDFSYYTLKSGDSIASIAKNLKVPTNYLLKLNGITNPTKLRPGQKIKFKNLKRLNLYPEYTSRHAVGTMEHEGLKLDAYVDSNGRVTIGYGRAPTDGSLKLGTKITNEKALEYWDEDMGDVVNILRTSLTNGGLTLEQINALADIGYHKGPSYLRNKIIPLINKGKLNDADNAMWNDTMIKTPKKDNKNSQNANSIDREDQGNIYRRQFRRSLFRNALKQRKHVPVTKTNDVLNYNNFDIKQLKKYIGNRKKPNVNINGYSWGYLRPGDNPTVFENRYRLNRGEFMKPLTGFDPNKLSPGYYPYRTPTVKNNTQNNGN